MLDTDCDDHIEDESDVFWIYDPVVLVTKLEILPTAHMSRNRYLNVISRMIILISAILWINKDSRWWKLLLIGLGVVIGIWTTTRSHGFIDTRFKRKQLVYKDIIEMSDANANNSVRSTDGRRILVSNSHANTKPQVSFSHSSKAGKVPYVPPVPKAGPMDLYRAHMANDVVIASQNEAIERNRAMIRSSMNIR